jgi:hypothetical protein
LPLIGHEQGCRAACGPEADRHAGLLASHAKSAVSCARFFLLMTGDRPIGAIEKAGAVSPSEVDELRSFIKSIKPLEPGAGLALGSF